MNQYINKADLVAKIRRRFDEYSTSILKHYDACKEAKAQELGKILIILDTLEVKSEKNLTDEEMIEALRTEYEKGRADTIAEMQKSACGKDKNIKETLINYFKERQEAGDCDELFCGLSYNDIITWFEKQGEQKPTKDIKTLMSLDEAIEHCKEKSCGNNACALEHKQLEEWLIELKELKEQTPTWSEEDEQLYNRIYDIIHTAAYANYDVDEDGKALGEYAKITNWFKELKDRVQLQPKQECGKEDATIVNSILSCIEHCKIEDIEAQYNGNHNVDPKRYESMSNWLKDKMQSK